MYGDFQISELVPHEGFVIQQFRTHAQVAFRRGILKRNTYHGLTHMGRCYHFRKKSTPKSNDAKNKLIPESTVDGLGIGVASSYGLLKQFNTLLKEYFKN